MLQSAPMDQHPQIVEACVLLGGAARLARALRVTPSMVTQWARGSRPVALDRCPSIERSTLGAVPCEALRPDVAWARIPDPDWPHPAGRPVLDIARHQAVQEAA